MGLLSWLSGKKAADADGARDAAAGDSDAAAGKSAPQGEDAAEAAGLQAEQLDVLKRAIESRNGAARIDAARALLERWQRGDGEAATLLVDRVPALLEDEEPAARQLGLAAVSLMRKPENLQKHTSAVLALLADKSGAVRTAAVRAAIKLPGDVARAQVRAVLTGTDEPMRFDAATGLAQVQDSAALPALVEALHEGIRRQEALSALMSLGDAAALPPLGELWESDEAERIGEFDRTMLAAAMARFGDERGAAHLAERAATPGDDRPVAVEWAGRLGVKQAIPALEELSEEEGEPARGAALRALGRLKADGAEARLLKVSNDADLADDLRMDAAEGLAEIGSDAALAALRDLSTAEGELGEVCRDLLAELAAAAAQAAAAEQPTDTKPAGDSSVG